MCRPIYYFCVSVKSINEFKKSIEDSSKFRSLSLKTPIGKYIFLGFCKFDILTKSLGVSDGFLTAFK